MNTEMITRKEFAALLGISTRTLDRVDNLPEGFPQKRMVTKRRCRYLLADVNAWLCRVA